MPAAVRDSLGLVDGDAVEMFVEKDELVIRPEGKRAAKLPTPPPPKV